jgi:tetratricopeptide (TPR) repeat protein
MIGLKSGTWHFTVEAPGYFTVETNAPIRVAAAPPMQFALAKDPGPIPNALDRNIEQLIQEAATARDAGRLDQAIAAYQDIRTRNPKLTSVNLVIGDLYRRKAAQETDPNAKQNFYRQALDAYDQLLKSDATNVRARAESDAIRAASRNE